MGYSTNYVLYLPIRQNKVLRTKMIGRLGQNYYRRGLGEVGAHFDDNSKANCAET